MSERRKLSTSTRRGRNRGGMRATCDEATRWSQRCPQRGAWTRQTSRSMSRFAAGQLDLEAGHDRTLIGPRGCAGWRRRSTLRVAASAARTTCGLERDGPSSPQLISLRSPAPASMRSARSRRDAWRPGRAACSGRAAATTPTSRSSGRSAGSRRPAAPLRDRRLGR